jgi:hypothetical protein
MARRGDLISMMCTCDMHVMPQLTILSLLYSLDSDEDALAAVTDNSRARQAQGHFHFWSAQLQFKVRVRPSTVTIRLSLPPPLLRSFLNLSVPHIAGIWPTLPRLLQSRPT